MLNTLLRPSLVFALLVAGLSGPAVVAETRIVVGAYYYPPIVQVSPQGQPEGLLADLLTALEQRHPDYIFEVFQTSPKRRYLDFEAGRYDVIFFESPDWQWSDMDALISPPLLTDADQYVALNKPGRDQRFFDNIEERAIVAMYGYHYAFADLETDARKLMERFRIEFSDSHERNLKLIKADRPSVAEVAVVSRSYLQLHFQAHPEDRDRLLISETPDQTYQLSVITRPDAPLTSREMMALLAPLIQDGSYQALVEKWLLTLPDNLEQRLPRL